MIIIGQCEGHGVFCIVGNDFDLTNNCTAHRYVSLADRMTDRDRSRQCCLELSQGQLLDQRLVGYGTRGTVSGRWWWVAVSEGWWWLWFGVMIEGWGC